MIEIFPLALFGFPIVLKKNDRGERAVLVRVVDSSDGQSAGYWTNLGLDVAETKARQLTGKLRAARWNLVTATGNLERHAADEESGQLALYFARVALDREVKHIPYGTQGTVWATGAIDANGLRQDMKCRDGMPKIRAFLNDPAARLLLAPACLLNKTIEYAPQPMTLADFGQQWRLSSFWTDRQKVIVSVEQHELEQCADCLLPEAARSLTLPQIGGPLLGRGESWTDAGNRSPISSVLTQQEALPMAATRLKRTGLGLLAGSIILMAAVIFLYSWRAKDRAESLCRQSLGALVPENTSSLSRALDMLDGLSLSEKQLCFVRQISSERPSIEAAVFAINGLVATGMDGSQYGLVAECLFRALEPMGIQVGRLALKYAEDPAKSYKDRMNEWEPLAKGAYQRALQLDEWLMKLPHLSRPKSWTPSLDREVVARLDLSGMLVGWMWLHSCASFPRGIEIVNGQGIPDDRPGWLAAMVVSAWIGGYLGGGHANAGASEQPQCTKDFSLYHHGCTKDDECGNSSRCIRVPQRGGQERQWIGVCVVYVQ